RKTFRNPVQPEVVGGPAHRDGNVLAGWPSADARSRRHDRWRASSRAPADGSERALRISSPRRIPGAAEWLPSFAPRRAASEDESGRRVAEEADRDAERWQDSAL